MADRFLDGFALLGSDERGAITWTGGAVESLCGRGPESLRGRALGEVIREVVGAEAGAAFEEALASGAGFRLTGETLVVEAAPIAGAARPQGWCLTLRAALAPVDAAALAESEERYRRLVEACPEPIVVHAGGRSRFANPLALALLGAGSAAEVLDRPMMDFVHPEFRAVVAERVRKMLETGGPAMLLEERIVRPDGSVLEVEIAGAAVCFQGELAIQLVGCDQ